MSFCFFGYFDVAQVLLLMKYYMSFCFFAGFFDVTQVLLVMKYLNN